MSSKQLLYRVYVWLVVIILLATVSGCGPDNTPAPTLPGGGTGAPGGGVGAQVTTPPTNTPAPTNTPVPTPTPTEIPVLFPTATPVGPLPPPGTGGLLPPTIPAAPSLTPSPTVTPTPTISPTATVAPTATPTITPFPTVRLNIVANYMIPLFGYSILGYYPQPELTTPCINEAYLNRGVATPTPAATSSAANPTPTPVALYEAAPDDYWYDLFKQRYILPNAAQNVTPGPVNASTPFGGPLPAGRLTVTATPNPPVPFAFGSELRLGSLIITDTISTLSDITYYKPELMVMWNVMNNLTRQLVDPAVDPKAYQQAFEASLNQLVNAVLRVNRLSRIIIGNVPDLTNMRYFLTCFNNAQLQQIQRDYNAMFNAVAARYPGRVYIARLDLLDLRAHPQWIFLGDGLRFTKVGATEIAAAFGREFQKIRYR